MLNTFIFLLQTTQRALARRILCTMDILLRRSLSGCSEALARRTSE
jgi:hypothetical protein